MPCCINYNHNTGIHDVIGAPQAKNALHLVLFSMGGTTSPLPGGGSRPTMPHSINYNHNRDSWCKRYTSHFQKDLKMSSGQDIFSKTWRRIAVKTFSARPEKRSGQDILARPEEESQSRHFQQDLRRIVVKTFSARPRSRHFQLELTEWLVPHVNTARIYFHTGVCVCER